jgi:ribosome-binding protein aMBF1 (putative translation factor)
MQKCNFCGKEGDWKNVIRSTEFRRFDGGDVTVCNECLNDYANYNFDKLTEKMKRCGKECFKD